MFPLTLLSLNAPEGVQDRLPSRVPVVSQTRINDVGKKGIRSEKEEAGNQLNFQGTWGYCGGGADQDRTGDLLNAIQALSQLSYSPTGDA